MNTNHNGIIIYGQYRLPCTIPDPATGKSDRGNKAISSLRIEFVL
jgi:hypothetical protein